VYVDITTIKNTVQTLEDFGYQCRYSRGFETPIEHTKQNLECVRRLLIAEARLAAHEQEYGASVKVAEAALQPVPTPVPVNCPNPVASAHNARQGILQILSGYSVCQYALLLAATAVAAYGLHATFGAYNGNYKKLGLEKVWGAPLRKPLYAAMVR
jgi:hypothetical protein